MEMDNAAAFAAGEVRRAGGLALTQHAIALCGFAPGSRLADIGCGQGVTVRYLRAAGFDACGLDIDAAVIARAGLHCQVGDALTLPYPANSMDGLLFECSLSPLDAKELALAEAMRVLKTTGKLIITDLYAQKESPGQQVSALLNRQQWLALLDKPGFSATLFEDRGGDLKALTAQVLWQYGREGLKQLYGCADDTATLKAAGASYFLLLAQKKGDE